MKRKNPTLKEKLAALILQHFDIPHEHATKMTTAEILSLIETDHNVHVKVAIANGEAPSVYNHPSRLTIRLFKNHRIKTAEIDIPVLAKSDRIEEEHEAYRRRILAKSQPDETEQVPHKPKRKAKIPSRPFAKPPEGHKYFQRGKDRRT